MKGTFTNMDDLIRISAFHWLEEQTNIYGDVLLREILVKGFEFQDQRITLMGPQGIWKPRIMSLPISITTVIDGPYRDSFTKEGFLEYKYRGNNPNHSDNVGLRKLMKQFKPLIYFHGLIKGKYLATWPVYIVKDDLRQLSFSVAVDEVSNIKTGFDLAAEDPGVFYRRSYLTANIRTRLHQRSFRERVILAYQNQCALCNLRHIELLDAAHIISDSEDMGDPIVQNGLALCKIHHAAFDNNIIGINPDYIIKVREDVLSETDGPMLKYGLQLLENNKIMLPKRHTDWPDRERLEIRYKAFMKAV